MQPPLDPTVVIGGSTLIENFSANSPFLQQAMLLVQAGWDGVNEACFKPSETDPNELRGYDVSVNKGDLTKVKEAAKVILVKKSSVNEGILPVLLSRPQTPFDRAFEMLRQHLLSLSNPYAVTYIHGKLKTFCTAVFDPSDEQGMKGHFEDPTLPPDTKEMLKQLVSGMIERTRSLTNTAMKEQIINEMLKELKEFARKWDESNQTVLKDFGWNELEILFKIPAFLALRDIDYKKLMMRIDSGVHKLREYIEELEERKLFDKMKAEEALQNLEYEYDLDTLLGEVCSKKPLRKEGILTYWNHPETFFRNKTLDVADPLEERFQGTILNCTRTPEELSFLLDDRTIVRVSSTFVVHREINHSVRKLWTSILTGSLAKNEEFSIEASGETDNKGAIQPGNYKLSNAMNVKGRGVFGSGYWAGEHFECTLVDPYTGTIRYTLQGEYTKTKEIHQIRIISRDGKKVNLPVQSFERMHIAFKKEQRHLSKIHKGNAESCILIKSELNEDKLRLVKLEKLKQQLNVIRSELLSEERRPLLNTLLDNLVKNKLKSIDFDVLQKENPDLAKAVKALAQAYFDDLKDQRSPSTILLQLALEANYAIHVDKKENIVIAKTMELLKDAYVHIEKMREKEVVFFMGNTGAGKSTAIGFLMGAEIVEFTNHVGEKVIQLGTKTPASTYPKIGQSIGTSETIYTQGFEMPSKDHLGKNIPSVDYMLGDCPGFNDTRGGDYELCTNLSIDKAVEHAKNIRSIIVVIPASAFLIDRGNNVIELVSTVQERFPDTFKATGAEGNPRVYLLVTKSNQLHGDAVRKLADGTRVDELVKETQAQLTALTESGANIDSFEIQSSKRRLDVWKAIQLMQPNQIHFIDTKNKKQRQELLALYSRQYTPKKGPYQKAMAGDYMQRKFGDCVQMSAHSWNRLILGQYLEAIPKLIETSKLELTRKKVRLDELNTSKKQKIDHAKKLGEEIQILSDLLQQLKENEDNLEDENLRQKLLEKASNYKNEKLEQEKVALANSIVSLASKVAALKTLDTDIEALESKIDYMERLTDAHKMTVKKLKTGDEVTVLWERIFNPDQELNIRSWKEGAREEAFKRLAESVDDFDPSKTRKVLAKDYKGITFNNALIERGYRIVPAEAAARKQFLSSFQGGGYLAKIDGLRYTIDLGCKSMPEGKKIAYGYQLKWDPKEPLPWIRISHTLPRHEFNAATINDLDAEITLYEKELIALQLQLKGNETVSGKLKEQATLKLEIEGLQAEQLKTENTIKEIQENHLRAQLKDWAKQTEAQIADIQKQKIAAENVADLDEKIVVVIKEMKGEQANLETHQRTLRDIAIIISTQWESARLLRQFAEFVLEGENNPQSKSATQLRCEEFTKVFDKNMDTLLPKIQTEHGF